MTEVREATAVYSWSPTIPDMFDGQLRIDLPDGFVVTEEWWQDLYESNRHVRIDLLPTRELRIADGLQLKARLIAPWRWATS